ncbi:hypothetical protein ACHAWO_012801 [Cyclotella atomus]|uniref:Uncharacterized protein n=1 Tax=Cyclotella atomus TaxID=382360 RepID=A0ABD3NV80_9STRA
MASKNSLTEPLLEDAECSGAHLPTVDDVREAVEESHQLKQQLEANPSYQPLITTEQQLEYEPSDIDESEPKQEKIDTIKFTSNEPVWQTCHYCNTTSETTTVHAFGSKELGRCEAKCCQLKKTNEKKLHEVDDDDIEKRLAEAREVTL